MNHPNQRDGVFDGSFFVNSMAEVEDMPVSAGGLAKNALDGRAHGLGTSQQNGGVEVPLNRTIFSD